MEVSNPYAAPQAPVASPGGSAELVRAGRGLRLGAYLIDGILYAACFMPGYVQLSLAGAENPIVYGALGTGVSVAAALAGAALFACNLWLLHAHGQTVAKRWLDIRIVRGDGSRAGLGRLFWLRMFVPWLIGAIPCLGTLFTLADALAIFGDDRRCLHDMMADTIVVVA